MGNYKPQNNIILVGGFTHVLPSGATPINLTHATRTTTGTTFHDMATGADYQVPTGKQLILVGIVIESFATQRTCTFYSATAADGTTGEVDKVILDCAGDGKVVEYPLPYLPSFPADTYPTWKVSSVTTAPNVLFILGYLIDA